MIVLITTFWLSQCLLLGANSEDLASNRSLLNSTDPNQDMYVINAVVYQVGIITNKTDNETSNYNTGGQQEAVTFYHTNGTNIDLSKIPEPLLTNVTAQSVVEIAPTDKNLAYPSELQSPWSTWDHLAISNQPEDIVTSSDNTESQLSGPSTLRGTSDGMESDKSGLFKRYLHYVQKRHAAVNETPVQIVNGAAVIPSEAGVQSIGLPPLLALYNNFSQIPVPIPNTSVVHYAKINTLVGIP